MHAQGLNLAKGFQGFERPDKASGIFKADPGQKLTDFLPGTFKILDSAAEAFEKGEICFITMAPAAYGKVPFVAPAKIKSDWDAAVKALMED